LRQQRSPIGVIEDDRSWVCVVVEGVQAHRCPFGSVDPAMLGRWKGEAKQFDGVWVGRLLSARAAAAVMVRKLTQTIGWQPSPLDCVPLERE
jgi:hypothetical protein